MTDIDISTSMFPFRLRMKEKDAGELTVEVTNQGEKAKNLMVEVLLPSAVGPNKSGLSKGFQKRLENFAPGKTYVSKTPIFPTARAMPGVHSGIIRVMEYAGNYDYETRTLEKEISFRIVD